MLSCPHAGRQATFKGPQPLVQSPVLSQGLQLATSSWTRPGHASGQAPEIQAPRLLMLQNPAATSHVTELRLKRSVVIVARAKRMGSFFTHPSKVSKGAGIHRKKAEVRRRHPQTRREMRETGWHQCSAHAQSPLWRRRRAQHQQHECRISSAASRFEVQPTNYGGRRGNITTPRCSKCRPVAPCHQHTRHATHHLASGYR
ncbi:hypothetical protein MRX96_017170 [Rhipicephalus microplus]